MIQYHTTFRDHNVTRGIKGNKSTLIINSTHIMGWKFMLLFYLISFSSKTYWQLCMLSCWDGKFILPKNVFLSDVFHKTDNGWIYHFHCGFEWGNMKIQEDFGSFRFFDGILGSVNFQSETRGVQLYCILFFMYFATRIFILLLFLEHWNVYFYYDYHYFHDFFIKKHLENLELR
jgi:hypothetical protein